MTRALEKTTWDGAKTLVNNAWEILLYLSTGAGFHASTVWSGFFILWGVLKDWRFVFYLCVFDKHIKCQRWKSTISFV